MKKAIAYRLALLSAGLLLGSSTGWAQFPRTVLIEEFTSVTCVNCPLATEAINDVIKAKGNRVGTIRYHLNFPVQGDPWYKANPQQNEARKSYYNVPALPYGRVDGNNASVADKGALSDQVDERLAMESPVQLTVTQTRNENQVTVMVRVTAGENALEDQAYHLRVAAVESHIRDESVKQIAANNGEVEFHDVMRTMLPNPDGVEITLGPGETKEFPYTYTVGSGWQADQMYTVAFVQSGSSTEIVQAGFSERPAASGVESAALAGYSLGQNVPNPAAHAATIGYTLGGRQNVTIELFNAAGERVAKLDQGMRDAGAHQVNLSLDGVPAGAYIYTIQAGPYRASHGLTVVR